LKSLAMCLMKKRQTLLPMQSKNSWRNSVDFYSREMIDIAYNLAFTK
jgi:hypothetical protein